ncbi:hypothetical protein [Lyngbya sp. CCAP 1446/10]|uniref:hypothetical protein n=1 Tax=Lyngbya sp. CCAP 1446/10 TaxID=439293 RepID=UPI002238C395|nr:hypothetical protein [Lyngbya sp. CCAP 1446/10]
MVKSPDDATGNDMIAVFERKSSAAGKISENWRSSFGNFASHLKIKTPNHRSPAVLQLQVAAFSSQ